MSCIGTAGHVDHGKSTLVTALTGIDPDRLAEEKSRGMTIDLGFAWLTLPSGREVSLVDVPGHESFIKNMLAGVGGIDVALLVVAADDGVMPQTEEHLAILDLLRVRAGVVALTKSDLVEAEWLELVRDDIAERLKPTTLAGAPIVACSGVTRAGLPELLAALDAALDAAPGRRDVGRPRLPVDRVFTITGFGTVVTGTLQDGIMRLGQEVEVLPRGLRGRIRGLQAHKQSIEEAQPGGRLAVNLVGVAKSDMRRGDVLALPGRQRATTALDVQLEVVAGAPRGIPHNAELDLYLGAAETLARVLLLAADELRPGERGWAQLRLSRPIVAAHGDHFILRVPSPSLTIGGGLIVEPWARRHRRHDATVLARLELLARGNPEEVVLASLRGETRDTGKTLRASGFTGLEPAEIARMTGVPLGEVMTHLRELMARELVIGVGAAFYATSVWQRLRAESEALLSGYHQQHPLRAGMPREEWRARLGLGARELGAVVTALVAAGALAEVASAGGGQGTFLKVPAFEPRMTPQQEQAVAALLERVHEEPFTPPTRPEVEEALGAEVTLALIERGTLVKLDETILLERGAYQEALRRLVGHLRAHETLTVAEARDLLGTTRKYMLAILAYTDQQRITTRRGDDRVLGPRAPSDGTLAG
jgi:selenocysteine-specific elongation factor